MTPGMRRVLTLTAGQLFVAGSAFVVSVLSARVLGLEQRGQFALAFQLAYILGPLLSFGMSNYLLRGHQSDVSLRAIVIVPVWLGLGAAALPWLFGLARVFLWGALCGITFSSVLVIRSYLIGRGQVGRAALVWSLSSFLFLVAAAVFYLRDTTAVELWLLPYLTVAFGFAVLSLFGLPQIKSVISLMRHSGSQVPGALGQIIALRLDRLLLAALCGEAELAVYVMAAVALESSLFLISNYADTLVVGKVDSFASATPLRPVIKVIPIVVALVAVGAAATQWIVLPFIGTDYTELTSLLLPLSLATGILGLFMVTSRLLLAGPRPGLASVPSAMQAAAAPVVYWIGASNWCTQGVAWGSAIVYAIGLAAAAFLLARESRTQPL